MSISSIINVSETPTIRRWRVIEVEKRNGSRSRHICGHDVTNDRGRASTAIMEFNWETMIATTIKDSKYKLVGAPGHSHRLENVWQIWRSIHEVVSEVDVTSEYFNTDKIFGNKPSFPTAT